MSENKKPYQVDNRFKDATGFTKFRYTVGGLCFVIAGAFVMIHLGFMEESYNYNKPMKPFLTSESIWYVNSTLGIVGGLILGYKRFIIAILSGLIASLAITGATLLYLSWRETILMAEIIIPMLAGVVGIILYDNLAKLNQSEP